jgi:glycosyltransferase involved in cell wall biosynthesis
VSGWHLLTGEAPGAGGIGDYTATLAEGLRDAGQEVRLWTERRPAALDAALDAFAAPRRLFFQYAPQAWGRRGMNLAICRWLLRRRARGDEVRVMFHEPFFPFGWQRPRRNALALVNRVMAHQLLRASTRAYLSTAAWEPLLRPLAPRGLPLTVLPVPSTIPFVDDAAAVQRLRATLSGGGARRVVAHFGTYGDLVAPLLETAMAAVRGDDVRFLLLGRGAYPFAQAVRARRPELDVVAPGPLAPADLSLHLQAADAALQPYPDGVDTRRTTMMACLACGVPTATTRGRYTDPVWDAAPLALAPAPEAAAEALDRLLAAAADRERIRRFYADHFAVERTVERLLR